jgi:hypothetical protein
MANDRLNLGKPDRNKINIGEDDEANTGASISASRASSFKSLSRR